MRHRNSVIDPDLADMRVFAFVGPAGTGKSQRAQFVADYLDAAYIVDDGLVIRRATIMCGKSAKTERNQIRAIRRALFEYGDHRTAVVDFLRKARPRSIMIIATSDEMASKIIKKLGLPSPVRTVRIDEVATPEEIDRARRERSSKGQHVIPVSHVQVSKNFAGKLVGRLRVLWRSSVPYDGEKTIVRPPFSFYGNVRIEPGAIEQLCSYVAGRQPQVDKVSDVDVSPDDEEQLRISLGIVVSSGQKSIMETARSVRLSVASSVRYFTGLDVISVDVNVVGVNFNYERKK
jgi:uncharacterized alkaline shock family protein YloU